MKHKKKTRSRFNQILIIFSILNTQRRKFSKSIKIGIKCTHFKHKCIFLLGSGFNPSQKPDPYTKIERDETDVKDD